MLLLSPTHILSTFQARSTRLYTAATLLATSLAALFLLGACVNGVVPLPTSAPSTSQTDALSQSGPIPANLSGILENISNYEMILPTPTPAPLVTPTPVAVSTPISASESVAASQLLTATEGAEKVYVVVITTNARANIRANADANAQIIGKGNPGAIFEVIGQAQEGAWLQICCVPEAAPDTAGWVSAAVVEVTGDVDPADVSNGQATSSATTATTGTVAPLVITPAEPLLSPDLQVEWQVDWRCGSERCTTKQCNATVSAAVKGTAPAGLLPIQHNVAWDQTCFSTDSWVFEVDRTTGREQSGQYEGNFLYGYWLGPVSSEPTGVFPLPSGKGVLVYCTGPQGIEVPEGDGWLSIYEGSTCHDLRTGVLVYMRYEKRWLFSGEFDGQNYERAFFGDTEILEQRLTDTNLELSYVQKGQ